MRFILGLGCGNALFFNGFWDLGEVGMWIFYENSGGILVFMIEIRDYVEK